MLGYWYRHKVVHQVRQLYEQVVTDIQPEKDFLFADESVTWPCKAGLCYPVFQARDMQESETSVTREIPLKASEQCTRCKSIPELGKDKELVFNKDRESLLEIRSKLSMELVWLKQAITSRQKVSLNHQATCSKVPLDLVLRTEERTRTGPSE